MQRLVQAFDAVKATRSRKAKINSLARFFALLSRDEVAVAARLILGNTGNVGVDVELLIAAAAEVAGQSPETVALKSSELGDFGEALEVLLPAGRRHVHLLEVPDFFERLAATRERHHKQHVLAQLLKRAAPWEARFLVKALMGELRNCIQLCVFEEALADAFDATLVELRNASGRTPDPGALALLTFDRRLRCSDLIPGSPVAFMRGIPMEVTEPVDTALTIVEETLVGIRAQAHVFGGQVRIFTQGHQDLTSQVPELVQSFAHVTHTIVLDGTIVATHPDGKPRPLYALLERLNGVTPTAQTSTQSPVTFVAFDCMFDNEVLLDQPWTERRRRLEALDVRVSPVSALHPDIDVGAQLDDALTVARTHGNEGLMLKRIDARYEAGRRTTAWRKVKRSFTTLDVVITQAETGHGKRSSMLSDYTFAVWNETELLELGHAYCGLPESDMAFLAARLEALTLSRAGTCRVVKPELVIEVAFDALQKSTENRSGYALAFPRIERLRQDKPAHQADTLATVEALFEVQNAAPQPEKTRLIGVWETF